MKTKPSDKEMRMEKREKKELEDFLSISFWELVQCKAIEIKNKSLVKKMIKHIAKQNASKQNQKMSEALREYGIKVE